MCPFCMATAVWIVAGAVSTGGISVLAVAKVFNSKAREREEGGRDEQQSAK